MSPAAKRRFLPSLGALMLAATLGAADVAPPWTETFQMRLQDRDRTYVVRNRVAYLVMEAGDLKNANFLAGKEVALLAKYERTDGQRAFFFGFDRFSAAGDLEFWANRIEGDNLHLFGVAVLGSQGLELRVSDVVAARSDRQIVDERLAAVKPDDWKARRDVALWVREQAEIQGNDDWWRLTADSIVAETANAAAERANAAKDPALLAQAFIWALDEVRDAGLAAQIVSQPWFSEQNEAKLCAKRLTALGFDRYQDVWRPRAQSLTLQFEDRFAATPWRDAEAFYKLGRWVDRNSEDLPRARDLSFRCYQAGYRADPAHVGIRRELGMADTGSGGAQQGHGNQLEGPYRDERIGVVIGGPEGWMRRRPHDSDALWIDPNSDTAYVSAAILSPGVATNDLNTTWEAALLPWRVRSGFVADSTPEPAAVPTGMGLSMNFRFQEGSDLREAQIVLVHQSTVSVGVVLVASHLPSEGDRARAALLDCVSKVTIPDQQASGTPENTDTENAAP